MTEGNGLPHLFCLYHNRAREQLSITIMKRICTLFVFLACFLSSFAYDVVVDGIYYDLVPKAKIAKVTEGDGTLATLYRNKVYIPDYITVDNIQYTVTEICPEAFQNCTSLTSVSVPNTLTIIGEHAFEGCRNLGSVNNISNSSITTIGREAFWKCETLSSITLPNSVTEIGEKAFIGCKNLASVKLSNSLASIGNSAFYGCEKLTSIDIPNSVTEIGEQAFMNCSSMTSITIPNSVTKLNYTFEGCSSLTSIEIPNSITDLHGTFRNCSSLTTVEIPSSVTSIEGAFYGCSSLTSISIPVSVTGVLSLTFHGCSSLISIEIPNSITGLHSTFYGCSSLTSISIPNSITYIGDSSFKGCTNLTSVSIPKSVKRIKISAFADCKNLADVFCGCETLPTLERDVFKNVFPEYSTLHVPASAIDSYRTADQWKDFGKIVTLETGETPAPKQCAAPTIVVENGKVSFTCETEGVEFISEVKENCTKNYYSSSFSFAPIYTISVYATKTGYVNSEIVKKTVDLTSGGGLKGDMNEDGQITVADVTELVNAVLEKK